MPVCLFAEVGIKIKQQQSLLGINTARTVGVLDQSSLSDS